MPHQNVHSSDFAAAGAKVRWLDELHAKHAYAYAMKFSSSERYGLNERTVRDIERLVIDSYSVAAAWLTSRLDPTGTVQVVYGEADVCVLGATDLLAKWQELFVPGRDDVIILHNENSGVAFYSHEQELQFGRREA